MCEPVSIAMAAMAVVGGVMSAQQQAKTEGSMEDGRRKGQIEQVKQMNYANTDLRLEQADKLEQARQQLTEVNLQSLRNKGMVSAAIGESNITGNSMDRIKRITAAEDSREAGAIQENYQRDYQTLFANQVANVENTKSVLKGSQPTLRTSKVAQALNVVSGGVQGYGQGQSMVAANKQVKGAK